MHAYIYTYIQGYIHEQTERYLCENLVPVLNSDYFLEIRTKQRTRLPSQLKVTLLFLRFADGQMHLYQVLYVHSIELTSVNEIFVKHLC